MVSDIWTQLCLLVPFCFVCFFKMYRMCCRVVSCHWRIAPLFISFFTQPSVEERLKMSQWAGFCLLVTQRPMSTTCTVSGPLRRHLEAPSGGYLLSHYPPPHPSVSSSLSCFWYLHLTSKCNFHPISSTLLSILSSRNVHNWVISWKKYHYGNPYI